jgi:hypothetical protein
VPSFGFDLEPVILHCLRARRLVLFRDLALLALTVVMLLAAKFVGVLVLAGLVARFIYQAFWRMVPKNIRIAGAVVLAAGFVYLLFEYLGSTSGGSSDYSGYSEYSDDSDSSGLSGYAAFAVLMVFVFFGLVFGHLLLVYQTLRRTLGPEAKGPGPGTPSPHVRGLLNRIGASQLGNVTLYSGENPFIGGGEVNRAWSITLELDRPGSKSLNGTVKPVDPVKLHEHVHRRLVAMRTEPLPANERINGLNISWHVVGRGDCLQQPRLVHDAPSQLYYQGHPLIDGTTGVPYSVASGETINAIIRHPQGGIRAYQRVTVGAQGQTIWGRQGHVVAPAEDQDIMLSAFLHIAVEGRMLYGQFVTTMLPPIRAQFRAVDYLPSLPLPNLLWRVLWETNYGFASAVLLALPNSARTFAHMIKVAVMASGQQPLRQVRFDYGAKISARELAAEPDFDTFMQALDADKYTRLIERRINETVLDYLVNECGVDVSAYREQLLAIVNSGVIITGGTVSGQVSTGANAAMTQHQAPSSGTPAPSSPPPTP